MPVDGNRDWSKEYVFLSNVCLSRLFVYDHGHFYLNRRL
jgi:hypothetical protein